MSAAIFEFGPRALALLLTGLAVKLMDDGLDNSPADGTPARLPYALVGLTAGALLCLPWTASLFLSAYAVGMGYSLTDRMPTGLTGWQESLLATGFGIALLGPQEMFGSLLVMLCIQLADDACDQARDAWLGRPNLARRYGSVETVLAALCLFLLGLLAAPAKTILAIALSRLISVWYDSRQPAGEEAEAL